MLLSSLVLSSPNVSLLFDDECTTSLYDARLGGMGEMRSVDTAQLCPHLLTKLPVTSCADACKAFTSERRLSARLGNTG